MPQDILQALEAQVKSVGEATLARDFDNLKQKIGDSAVALSVLKSATDATSSSNASLHDRLRRIIKDFNTYADATKTLLHQNDNLASSWKHFGSPGVEGITHLNEGLSRHLVLLNSASRKLERYQTLLADTPSPTLDSPNAFLTLPHFNDGGVIRGTQRRGDKHLIRVNAGEWVLTEKQMDNLALLTGSHSRAEVFRKAGGTISGVKLDPSGLQRFASGGPTSIDEQIFQKDQKAYEKQLLNQYANATKPNQRKMLRADAILKEMIEMFQELTESERQSAKISYGDLANQLKQLQSGSMSVTDIDRNLYNNLFSTLANRPVAGRGADIKKIQQQEFNARNLALDPKISPPVAQAIQEYLALSEQLQKSVTQASGQPEVDALVQGALNASQALDQAMQQGVTSATDLQDALDKIRDTYYDFVNIDIQNTIERQFGNLSKEAQDWQVQLLRANQVLKDMSLPESDRNDAKNQLEIARQMVGYHTRNNLTQAQRDQLNQANLEIKQTSQSGDYEEAIRLLDGLKTGQLSLSDTERSVKLADIAVQKFTQDSEAMVESWKQFLGGTPTGMTAVAVGIGLASKALADFTGRISGSVKSLAELSIQSAKVEQNLTSAFGNNIGKNLRENLNLTKRELTAIGPLLQEAFRESGIELENALEVAENIKKSFGRVDASKLQEALGILGTLTNDQQQALLSATPTNSNPMAEVYANLMNASLSGKAADLLEQGVFGKDLEAFKDTAGLAPGDLAIVEELQKANQLNENFMSYGKDLVGHFSSLLKWGTVLGGSVIPAVGGIWAMTRGLGAVKLLFKRALPVRDSSHSSSSGGTGSSFKGALVGTASVATSGLMIAGFNKFSEYSQDAVDRKGAEAQSRSDRTYADTGFFIGDRKNLKSVDWTKVNARGAKYANIGSIAGGSLAGVAATGATLATGGVGATGFYAVPVAVAAGGVAGYATGSSLELKNQLGKEGNNAYLKINGSNNLNTELLKLAQATNKNLEELQAGQSQARTELIRSLRAQEKVESLVKKIDTGALARFAQLNLQGAQASNEMLSARGGSDAGFLANTSRIMESATELFNQNLQAISKKQQELLNQEGISTTARINMQNKLLEQQTQVVKKFLDVMLSTIGEYEKIPTVIQGALSTRISQLALGGTTGSLGMTSSMSMTLASANAKMASPMTEATAEKLAQDLKQIRTERDKTEQLRNESLTNFRASAKTNPLLDPNLVDETGTLNTSSLNANRQKLDSRRKKIEQEIETNTGIQNYTETLNAVESFKDHQAKFNQLNEEISKIDEKEFRKNRQMYGEKFSQIIESVLTEGDSILKNNNIDSKVKADFSKELEALKGIPRKISKNTKLDQFRTALAEASGTAGFGNSEIDKKLSQARNASKKDFEEISRAQLVLDSLASTTDNSTAVLRLEEKLFSDLQKSLEDINSASNALIQQIKENPTSKFWDTALEVMEASRDSILEVGDFSSYSASIIESQSEKIQASLQAAQQARAQISANRLEAEKHLSESVARGWDETKLKQLLDKAQELSAARLEVIENPTNTDKTHLTKLQTELDELQKQFTVKDKAGNATLDTGILALIQTATAQDQSLIKAIIEGNKAQSANYQLFKQMLSLMDGYKDQLNYLRTEASQRAAETGIALATKQLNGSAAESWADQGIASTERQLELTLDELAKAYDSDLKKLAVEADTALINGDVPALKVVQDKRSTLESEYSTKYLQAQVEASDKIARLAQSEYEAKKRTSDLALEAVGIQSELLSSLGAPAEAMMANERKRVELVNEQAVLAKKYYEEVRHNDQVGEEEKRKAQNEYLRKQSEAMRAALGAQRSIIEKVFGNMIGSFGEVAGIQGPNNIARKYGYGYVDYQNGVIGKSSGKATGGYRDRIFSNTAMTQSSASVPTQSGVDIFDSLDQATALQSHTGRGSRSGRVPSPTALDKAGKSSTSDSEWMTLGETFSSELKALEAVVFWEKKIYNQLSELPPESSLNRPKSKEVKLPSAFPPKSSQPLVLPPPAGSKTATESSSEFPPGLTPSTGSKPSASIPWDSSKWAINSWLTGVVDEVGYQTYGGRIVPKEEVNPEGVVTPVGPRNTLRFTEAQGEQWEIVAGDSGIDPKDKNTKILIYGEPEPVEPRLKFRGEVAEPVEPRLKFRSEVAEPIPVANNPLTLEEAERLYQASGFQPEGEVVDDSLFRSPVPAGSSPLPSSLYPSFPLDTVSPTWGGTGSMMPSRLPAIQSPQATPEPQKVEVEIMLKFDTNLFQEAIKRITTSPDTAREIARNGMEA